MDEREKSIYEAGEKLLAEQLEENIAAIEAAFQNAPEDCCVPFVEAIQTLSERVIQAQKEADKGPLRYLCVSNLLSSLYTGSYQLRIDAYDERLFGDMTDTCVYWSPDFIFQYMDRDMAYFRAHIGKHVQRIWEHEIMTFFARYMQYYYHLVQELVASQIEPIITSEFSDTPKLTVTFGGYMDQAVVLFEAEQVKG